MQHKLNKAQKRSPVQISNLLCDGVRNYFFNHVLACIAEVGRTIHALYFVIISAVLIELASITL